MRIGIKLAAAGAASLLAAAPAPATQGYACRTVAPEGVALDVVIGSGMPGTIVAATLRERDRSLSTATGDLRIGQSWLDEDLFLLDLLTPAGDRLVARLKTGVHGKLHSRYPTGTLLYGDRTWRIVCKPDR